MDYQNAVQKCEKYHQEQLLKFYDELNVVYHLPEGAVNSPDNLSTYPQGKSDIILGNASMEGYTFDGWYLSMHCLSSSNNSSGSLLLGGSNGMSSILRRCLKFSSSGILQLHFVI